MTTIDELLPPESYDVLRTTIMGANILQVIQPKRPQEFWDLWRGNKDLLKKNGVRVSKPDDWQIAIIRANPETPALELDPDIVAHCLPYQVQHVHDLCSILLRNGIVLDASDTGTGKTYSAILGAKQLGLRPCIICPLSVKSSWASALAACGVEHYDLWHYEQIRGGLHGVYELYRSGRRNVREWTLGQRAIIIFDEAHRTANPTTHQGRMMIAAAKSRYPVMLLSATACTSPVKMGNIAAALKLHSGSYLDAKKWLASMGCHSGKFHGVGWDASEKNIAKLHHELFPARAVRMRITDIPDFPETKIIADPVEYKATETKKLNKLFSGIAELQAQMAELRRQQAWDAQAANAILVQMLRMRQEVELIKCTQLLEMTLDALEENKHVAIFLNFSDSVELVRDGLQRSGIDCACIWGQNKRGERDEIIRRFESDELPVVICNISAGGVGISLHDKNGHFPRLAIISPTWSATDLKQALGRVHRAGAKTKSLQRIVFASGTVEEDVARRVKSKLDSLGQIQDLERFVEDFNFDEK